MGNTISGPDPDEPGSRTTFASLLCHPIELLELRSGFRLLDILASIGGCCGWRGLRRGRYGDG